MADEAMSEGRLAEIRAQRNGSYGDRWDGWIWNAVGDLLREVDRLRDAQADKAVRVEDCGTCGHQHPREYACMHRMYEPGASWSCGCTSWAPDPGSEP